jgi:hypothetical protein
VGDARQAAIYEAYRTIMAAARQGTISPRAAQGWARRAANGEDVSVLASLSGPPRDVRLEWMKAAAGGDLSAVVLEELHGYLLAARGPGGMTDAEADALLPPRGSALVPAPWEMTDEEADELLPPRTAEEVERHARAADVRAAAVEDLSDDDLYRLLFGAGE